MAAEELETGSSISIEEQQTPSNFGLGFHPIKNQPLEASPAILVQYQSDRFVYEKLYFEEPKLERQGVNKPAPLQLVTSSLNFFTQSTLFPLNVLLGRHRTEKK